MTSFGLCPSSIGLTAKRWIVSVLAATVAILLLIGVAGQHYEYLPLSFRPGESIRTEQSEIVPTPKAKYTTPAELMSRPMPGDLESIPKLFHQSWSSTELPTKMQRWSDSCREQHPDWEWVLWTDEDNYNLVKTFMPWLLKTYEDLPSVIYRADLVRNLYMYIFGGIYADLDVECLRSSDSLFLTYDTSTVPHNSPSTQGPARYPSKYPNGSRAYFGRMGTDPDWGQSIPNAWFASTPGHPFFLLVLDSVMQALESSSEPCAPECLTGPARLYDVIKRYLANEVPQSEIDAQGDKDPVAKHYTQWMELEHSATVLPHWSIYPYSWGPDGEGVREVCWASRRSFDPERCKHNLETERMGSWTITYWSHTWSYGSEGDGHQKSNLEAVGGWAEHEVIGSI